MPMYMPHILASRASHTLNFQG